MVAAYDGHGGHTHPRYLFPGLATLAAVGALGLDRLAGARHGLWVVGVALAQLALTGAAWAGSSSSSVGLRMAWRRPGNPARPAPPSHRRSPSLVASSGDPTISVNRMVLTSRARVLSPTSDREHEHHHQTIGKRSSTTTVYGTAAHSWLPCARRAWCIMHRHVGEPTP